MGEGIGITRELAEASKRGELAVDGGQLLGAQLPFEPHSHQLGVHALGESIVVVFDEKLPIGTETLGFQLNVELMYLDQKTGSFYCDGLVYVQKLFANSWASWVGLSPYLDFLLDINGFCTFFSS